MTYRYLKILVIALTIIIAQWACQSANEIVVQPEISTLSVEDAKRYYEQNAPNARASSVNDKRQPLWKLSQQLRFKNGISVIATPLLYNYSPKLATYEGEDKKQAENHFVTLTKLLTYRDATGQIHSYVMTAIQDIQSRTQKIEEKDFTGYVLIDDLSEKQSVDGWYYDHGKPKKRLGATTQDNHGRLTGCEEMIVTSWQPIDEIEAMALGWGGQACGAGGCSTEVAYVEGILCKKIGSHTISTCGGSAGTGGGQGGMGGSGDSGGGGGSTGGGGDIPPQTLTEDGVTGLTPVERFFYVLENERIPAILFSQEEKNLIRSYPQLIYTAGSIIDATGEKPDFRYMFSIVYATWNPGGETESQLGTRILTILGLSDYSQLEQAPFDNPGFPILTGLLYTQKIARESAVMHLMHPDWSQAHCLIEAVKNVSSGTVHFFLDAFGFVPGAGELADGINGGIYLLEGDNTSAGLSFAAMMPIGGWAATGGKWARNALKYDGARGWVSKSGLVYKFPGNVNRLDHVLDHMKDDISKGDHGIFFGTAKEVVELVDEGWELIQQRGITPTIRPDGYRNYVVDMGRIIGKEGGSNGAAGTQTSKLLIRIVANTSADLNTAFPIVVP